jgi:hypothetical protein
VVVVVRDTVGIMMVSLRAVQLADLAAVQARIIVQTRWWVVQHHHKQYQVVGLPMEMSAVVGQMLVVSKLAVAVVARAQLAVTLQFSVMLGEVAMDLLLI